MTKNVKAFIEQVKRNGVRLTNQFQITISNTGIDAVDKVLDDFTIWADGAQLPSVTNNKAELRYLGFAITVPTNIELSTEITVNVRCDKKSRIRDALLLWSSSIIDFDIEGGSVLGGDRRPTNTTLFIDLLDDSMLNTITTYKLYGCYPTVVGQADVSNVDSEIMTFPVTLTYQYWDYVNES